MLHMELSHVPELEHISGSWIVTRIKDSSIICEFYERSNVEKFNPNTCHIETALEYLTRINQVIKDLLN